MYKIGEIIAAVLPNKIEHYGIYTESGTVVSASKRTQRVTEEDLVTFSGGHKVIGKGYPSELNPYEVVSNARRLLGQKWNLFRNNCQHFATSCHGEKHSPQLQQILVLSISPITIFALAKRR